MFRGFNWPVRTLDSTMAEFTPQESDPGEAQAACFNLCKADALCTGFVHYSDVNLCSFRGGPGQPAERMRTERNAWGPATLFVKPSPVSLIIDTDFSIDVDDLAALCVAHRLADSGEVTLLAMLHGTGLSAGVGGISVVNHYFGRDAIPIGAYRGEVGAPEHTFNPDWVNRGNGWYVFDLLEKFDSPIRSADDVHDAVIVYRRTLSSAIDHSVVIASIGLFTNLLELLKSEANVPGADVDGVELIKRKVARLVVMGGRSGEGIEWNFGGCGGHERGCGSFDSFGEITKAALDLWPAEEVPITFLEFDAGVDVRTGGALRQSKDVDASSPCRRGFDTYCTALGAPWCTEDGRPSWDPMTILMAVRGTEGYYQTKVGHNEVYADNGGNLFSIGSAFDKYKLSKPKDHRREYKVERTALASEMADVINALMLPVPPGPPLMPPPPMPTSPPTPLLPPSPNAPPIVPTGMPMLPPPPPSQASSPSESSPLPYAAAAFQQHEIAHASPAATSSTSWLSPTTLRTGFLVDLITIPLLVAGLIGLGVMFSCLRLRRRQPDRRPRKPPRRKASRGCKLAVTDPDELDSPGCRRTGGPLPDSDVEMDALDEDGDSALSPHNRI